MWATFAEFSSIVGNIEKFASLVGNFFPTFGLFLAISNIFFTNGRTNRELQKYSIGRTNASEEDGSVEMSGLANNDAQ